jgi:alpha-mannosidase
LTTVEDQALRAGPVDADAQQEPLAPAAPEPALKPKPSVGERVLYMIGNAHIDPVWLWQWQEGLHQVRATFRAALDLMEQYDDFVFTCDSVAYLEWVERVDPQLFQQVSQRVSEGRFVVVGGWWIEPDCNLPNGESFVRQAVYGQRFLRDHFRQPATVGCNVDPFGHAATLPQLLSKAGITSYVFLRPQPKEKTLPGELFWWASPDGSRVLAYRIPYAYCSPGTDLDAFIEQALERAEPDLDELMIFYGVGNHGGGPTRENLASIGRLNAAGNGLRLLLSSPEPFFEIMKARPGVPTYVGDLQHHAIGCYSAHSGVKRWNRSAEHLLLASERWSSVAALLGGPAYPKDAFAQAWKLVLFNQFHDILAGTAIAPAYEDARDQYGYATTVAADALNLAVQSVTRRVNIAAEDGTLPVVVINPLPWTVRADVEFEMQGGSTDPVGAVQEQNRAPVAVQDIQPLATVGGAHRRLVMAAELPPLGYRMYRFGPHYGPVMTGARDGRDAGDEETVLENAHLRVELDSRTGWLASLVDKDRDVDLVPPAASSHAVVLEDTSDTWSHDLVSYDSEIGRFSCTSVSRVEEGPVRSVIRVESQFDGSRLVELFILGRRARHLEIRASLDWRERQRALKLRFPSVLQEPTVTYSVPYGRIPRPNHGSEEVAQAWVDVSGMIDGGVKAGWSLLNDGKYAYDVKGSEIGMTAARSPVYAWHDPYKLDPGGHYDYLDQGRQDFTYCLLPHAGDLDEAGTVRLAEELNERPFAQLEHFHPGSLPPALSFADDGGGGVLMTVIKWAEDGNGVVVRAYDTTGKGGTARLELPFMERRIESRFAPGEVKTFLVPEQTELPVEEVSLLE